MGRPLCPAVGRYSAAALFRRPGRYFEREGAHRKCAYPSGIANIHLAWCRILRVTLVGRVAAMNGPTGFLLS
jgi:hypothetical protein